MASQRSDGSDSSGSSGKRSPPSGRRSRRERGLDEVLHYFISEDEQAEARAGREAEAQLPEPREGPPTPVADPVSGCWCLAVEPSRPLAVELAVEISRALAGDQHQSQIVASFPPHPLLPSHERVGWRVLERPDESDELGESIAGELDRVPPSTRSLLVLTPFDLARVMRSATSERIRGIALVVDTSSRGLGQALAVLRTLPRPSAALHVGVILVSSGEPTAPIFARLKGAARRQLGIALEQLGALERGAGDYDALLRGVPLLDAAPDGSAARCVSEISTRFGSSAADV